MHSTLSVEDALVILETDRRRQPRITCDAPRLVHLLGNAELTVLRFDIQSRQQAVKQSISRRPSEKDSPLVRGDSCDTDRQKYLRVTQAIHILWLPVSAGESNFAPAVLRFISANGFILSADRHVEPGTVITIRFLAKGGTRSWMPWAHVLYSKKQAANLWIMGCRFIGQLSDDWLATLTMKSDLQTDIPKLPFSRAGDD
jgi:hypothetical protein